MKKNKKEILERNKALRQANIEKVREQSRLSYEKNKDIKNRPYQCECGMTICFSSRLRHFKTAKHQQYLQSQHNPQE